jgi:uncharacterized protein YndB with AHSA1/START domain
MALAACAYNGMRDIIRPTTGATARRGVHMADILREFAVKAPPESVYEMFSTPAGLDRWWTKSSEGTPKVGGEYKLGFGPGYDWRAKVSRCVPGRAFEFTISDAHKDWQGTRVGCELKPNSNGSTQVRFYHTGSPQQNDHWRVSCFCWAMYLRLLRRAAEHGEFVPYEQRLDV